MQRVGVDIDIYPSPFMMTLPVIRHNACQVKQIILDFVKRNTAEYESKVTAVSSTSPKQMTVSSGRPVYAFEYLLQ